MPLRGSLSAQQFCCLCRTLSGKWQEKNLPARTASKSVMDSLAGA
jgi:hypothetical protein